VEWVGEAEPRQRERERERDGATMARGRNSGGSERAFLIVPLEIKSLLWLLIANRHSRD
jgi:hypothetical protein